jgi:hypothetical protein
MLFAARILAFCQSWSSRCAASACIVSLAWQGDPEL